MTVQNVFYDILYNYGLWSFVLPFFLFYIITYVAVSRLGIFKENKNLQIALSLVMTLLVVLPYAATGEGIVGGVLVSI